MTDPANRAAATMSGARARGWEWILSTAHQRWTQLTVDRIETVGYWFPAEGFTTPTAVLLHGHRADASLMGEFAAMYRRRGFNVLLADARGHGMSGGEYIGMGYLDQHDYLGWLHRITQTVGDGARIVLHGLSMGASTALMLSAQTTLPPQVIAVIADCGFTSAVDEFAYQVRRATGMPGPAAVACASLLTRLSAGYWLRQADALTAASITAVPVLVIHGDADTYNPTWMARALHDAIHSPKQLWIVPGAGHGESFFTHPLHYEQRVFAFLRPHLQQG